MINNPFSIVFAAINWYGLLIASGILLAGVLGYLSVKKRGHDPEIIVDGVLIAVPVSVIFARIHYIVFEENMPPSEWIKIWNGGLGFYGAALGAILSIIFVVFVLYKNKPEQSKMSMLQLLDITFSVFLVAQAIGRWGNFANKEVYGWALENQNSFFARFPFAVKIGSTYHLALFFYESMLNLLGFGIIFSLYHNAKRRSFDGFLFACYCIWYGTVRAILENFREPTYILWLIKDKLPISVFVSILLVFLGVGIIAWHIYNARKSGKNIMIFVPENLLSKNFYGYEKTVFYKRELWLKAEQAASNKRQNQKPLQTKQEQQVQEQEKEQKKRERNKEQKEFDDEL